MKRRLIRFSLTCTLFALPLCTLSVQTGSASPATITGEITDSICAPSGSHTAVMQMNPAMGRDNESCAKRCAQLGARYVLYDSTTKKVYTIDNQAKAAALAGQQVKVTGSITGSGIAVTSIAAA